MLENLTITIWKSTGKLGTMKCSESGWSNDFISLLLLVRSIFISLIWPGKKEVIVISLSNTTLAESMPLVTWFYSNWTHYVLTNLQHPGSFLLKCQEDESE